MSSGAGRPGGLDFISASHPVTDFTESSYASGEDMAAAAMLPPLDYQKLKGFFDETLAPLAGGDGAVRRERLCRPGPRHRPRAADARAETAESRAAAGLAQAAARHRQAAQRHRHAAAQRRFLLSGADRRRPPDHRGLGQSAWLQDARHD